MNVDLHLDDPVHRMIAAPTGGGKSYYVGAMTEQLYEQGHPFIVLDTKTVNHIGLVDLPGVKLLKISPKYDYSHLEKLLDYPYVLCVPASKNIDIADIINVYRQIVSYLWLQNGERTFICEEAHNWCKNASVPDPLFEKIAREGRGNKKFIWFITQRLQNFSQLLWAQCNYTYLFHFNIPSDIRYAAAMVPGFDSRRDDSGKKIPGLNQELNDHDVLVWDGRQYEIIRAKQVTRKTKHRG